MSRGIGLSQGPFWRFQVDGAGIFDVKKAMQVAREARLFAEAWAQYAQGLADAERDAILALPMDDELVCIEAGISRLQRVPEADDV